jgi:transcriptional regulator with GAF, ATPase, and Fis domain
LYRNENKGAIYFLTGDGKIYKFFLNMINELNLESFSSKIKPRTFFFNKKDELLLCGGGGVGSISFDEESNELKFNLILSEPSMYALESKYGGYWIATEENGLFRLKDGKLLHITEKNGLPTNNLYTLFEDREGTLWIGAALKGISKLPSLKFISFSKSEGFLQEGISSITTVNEKIFCTTENGLFVFKEPYFNKMKMITNEKVGRGSKFFFFMISLSSNNWLLGGADGLYMLSENGLLELIGLKGLWVQTFYKDKSEQIWIGTNKGLYKLRGQRAIIAQDVGEKEVNINAILEVNSKDLYLGTTEGLYILENRTVIGGPKTIRKLTTEDGLLSNLILDLCYTTDGEILVGTAEGINVLSMKGNYKIGEELNTRYIIDLFEDQKGILWAGTYNGLMRLEKRDGKFSVVKEYFQKDGLISNEFTRNNTIVEDKSGRIWIGTFGGLTVYDPLEDDEVIVKPPCFITSVQINDKDYEYSGWNRKEFNYTENKFSFSFEGLSFIDEQSVKYKYYLEPLEKKWANSTSLPSATYNYLEPGDYIFRVVAINPTDIQSEIQTWTFTIAPPFWKRWWFNSFLILLAGFLLYVVYNYRTRHIRKRNEQLQYLVNEKTNELSTANQKLEIQYKDLLEAQKKLVDKEKLEEAFREIEKLKNRLAVENIYLREKQTVVYEVGSIIGNSESTKKIREQILEVAPTDSTVLITGETGTGKTIIAEAIHTISKRKERAGVSVNCAAIPDGLVESELFGHEKGAFTGAHTRRVGKFEVADGSTIFLDEIGDMDLHIQAKVLTFLQERKFTRLGGNDLISVDVRIIAATNYDLEKLVAEGKFRKDLYHRLQVYRISVPSLRERYEDIEPLTKFFIDRFSKIMNKTITAINKAAIEKLKNYRFPGNVRELENIIQRAIIVCKGNVITDEDITISESKYEFQDDHDKVQKIVSLAEMERNYILAVLRKTKGKIAGSNGAAELLGLHPNTLRSRMEKLKIHTNQNLP